MKIAHIDTERTWRGGEQQVLSLVDGLARRGLRNFAVGRPGSPYLERLAPFAPAIQVNPSWEWALPTARALRRHLLDLGVDVIHAHTGHAVALGALAIAATQIPMVVTRRVDFPIGRNPLSRWKYGRAARIVAISAGVRDVLLADGIPSDRITLIPSGVDFRRYEKLPELSREDLGIPSGAFVVGQIAALAPHKDQETFIRTIALLRAKRPETVGVLVGGGELKASLEALTNSLGLSKSFYFLGHRDDALSCLRLFDVFCFSSWAEGLGTSIIDAMALRVPVASTLVGGIPDLLEDGVTGYGAPPRSPDLLAKAVERAAVRKEDVLSAARSRAEEFSIERTIDGMEKVYRSIRR